MNDMALGPHAVETAILAAPERIKRILMEAGAQKRLTRLVQAAEKAGLKVTIASKELLDKMSPRGNHQGVVAELKPFQYAELDDMIRQKGAQLKTVLMLDGVTDPQNLGAVLRSAGAFGADMIVLPKDRSVTVTPSVMKVASGAADVVPIVQEINLTRALEKLKEAGVWCYALEADGDTDLFDIDLKGPVALILGSEGKGLRPLVRKTADAVCRIPLHGPIPSLNVASAATCALSEVWRQRRSSK